MSRNGRDRPRTRASSSSPSLGAAREARRHPAARSPFHPARSTRAYLLAAGSTLGLEYVAGRPAHHVQCGADMWIDVATRLTLRSRAAGAGANGAPPGTGSVEVTSVELGQPPSELFEIRRPGRSRRGTPPEEVPGIRLLAGPRLFRVSGTGHHTTACRRGTRHRRPCDRGSGLAVRGRACRLRRRHRVLERDRPEALRSGHR